MNIAEALYYLEAVNALDPDDDLHNQVMALTDELQSIRRTSTIMATAEVTPAVERIVAQIMPERIQYGIVFDEDTPLISHGPRIHAGDDIDFVIRPEKRQNLGSA